MSEGQVYFLTGLLLLPLLWAGPAPAQEADPAVPVVEKRGAWEDLGIPVRRCGLYSQTLARDAAGKQVLCLGFKDTQCFLLLLDPQTGQGKQVVFTGVDAQIWSLCAHSNGKVYATLGSGHIFEVDPTTGEYRELARPPKDEVVVWELYEGPDGNLYGGTYPNAKLVRINPQSGEVTDLGRMDPEEMYVRTIALQGDYVYCGCGPKQPAVWAYHIPTGQKTQILPEEARQGPGWGRPTRTIDGQLLMTGAGDKRYQVQGLEVTATERKVRPAVLRLDDGRYVAIEDRSGPDRVYFLVDDKGGRTEVKFNYSGAGTTLFALFPGPDGRLYGTTRSPITLFALDPVTGAVTEYGDPVGHGGQVYAWLWREGKLHMTAYSRCTYSVWDPARPWRFGAEPESNPRVLGRLSRHVQRAGGMLGLPDGRVLTGGLPSYGYIGGGLVFIKPDEPAFELIEKPVGEQSPWALVLADEPHTVILGTDMMGGSGTQTAVQQSPARVVWYDYEARRITHEMVPWPEEVGLKSLLRQGNLLYLSGRTTGRLGVLDLRTRQLQFTLETGVAAGGRLTAGPDGKVYWSAEGHLLRLDPATGKCDTLATYPGLGEFITFAGDHVYGFADTRVLRLPLKP
jgi:streptogramin lyase